MPDELLCPACGNPRPTGGAGGACPRCGAVVPPPTAIQVEVPVSTGRIQTDPSPEPPLPTVACPHCGRRVPDLALLCPHCERPLRDDSPLPGPGATFVRNPELPTGQLGAAVAGVMGTALLLVFGIDAASGGSLREVAFQVLGLLGFVWVAAFAVAVAVMPGSGRTGAGWFLLRLLANVGFGLLVLLAALIFFCAVCVSAWL